MAACHRGTVCTTKITLANRFQALSEHDDEAEEEECGGGDASHDRACRALPGALTIPPSWRVEPRSQSAVPRGGVTRPASDEPRRGEGLPGPSDVPAGGGAAPAPGLRTAEADSHGHAVDGLMTRRPRCGRELGALLLEDTTGAERMLRSLDATEKLNLAQD